MAHRAGRPPKYPWDEWLQLKPGQSRLLVQGEHFENHPDSFRKQVALQVRRRDLAVQTELVKKPVGLRLIVRTEDRAAYPWNLWLDGKTHVLRRREDFWVTAQSIQSQIHHMARNRGMTVRTAIDGTRVFINPPAKRTGLDLARTPQQLAGERFFQAYAAYEDEERAAGRW